METDKFKLITRDYLIKNFNTDFVLEGSHRELKEKLNERRYSLNKSRHSPKNIIKWEELGLIKDNRKDNETWKKYSFTESVWIDLIKNLKKFGHSSKTILPIKERLCEVKDKDEKCEFTLLDFYIMQIIVEKRIVFVLTDELKNSVMVTKEHLKMVEQLTDYEYDDLVRINLTKIVTRNIEETAFTLR